MLFHPIDQAGEYNPHDRKVNLCLVLVAGKILVLLKLAG